MAAMLTLGLSCATTKQNTPITAKIEVPAQHDFSLPDSITSRHGCAKLFYEWFPGFVHDGKPYRKYQLIRGSTWMYQLLSCGLVLAKEGDTLAELIVLEYFKTKLQPTIKAGKWSEVIDLFMQLHGVVQLPSKQSMDICMQYFSTTTTYVELGYPKHGKWGDRVLGLRVFSSNILPMMEPAHRVKYNQMFNEMFRKYLITASADDNGKNLLLSFYPIIEKAWSEGNINIMSRAEIK